jgi:hypothetical protein
MGLKIVDATFLVLFCLFQYFSVTALSSSVDIVDLCSTIGQIDLDQSTSRIKTASVSIQCIIGLICDKAKEL